MKTILSLCTFLLFSLAVYSQSVVGTWTTQVPVDDQGNMMTLTFKMNADKSFSYQEGSEAPVASTYEVKGNELHIPMKNDDCDGTVICEFELKDASTMLFTPKQMPCGDGSVPPPLTLKKQ
jgi:hypothetical protein